MPNLLLKRPPAIAAPKPPSIALCDRCAAQFGARPSTSRKPCTDQKCVHHESCRHCGGVTDGRRLLTSLLHLLPSAAT